MLPASSLTGLADREVRTGRQTFGSNSLPTKRPVALREIILRLVKSTLIYILMIATCISCGPAVFREVSAALPRAQVV